MNGRRCGETQISRFMSAGECQRRWTARASADRPGPKIPTSWERSFFSSQITSLPGSRTSRIRSAATSESRIPLNAITISMSA